MSQRWITIKRNPFFVALGLQLGPFGLSFCLLNAFFAHRPLAVACGLAGFGIFFPALFLWGLRRYRVPALSAPSSEIAFFVSLLSSFLALRHGASSVWFLGLLSVRVLAEQFFAKQAMDFVFFRDSWPGLLTSLHGVVDEIEKEHHSLAENLRRWHGQNAESDLPSIYPIVESALETKRQELGEFSGLSIECVIELKSKRAKAAIQPEAFRQVVFDLLNFSLGGMDSGFGTLTVTLSFKKGQLYLKVVDSGKGVPAGSLTKKTASGVDLGDIKKQVESWGGQIEVSSVLGKGTTLTLRLPATT